MATIKDVAKYAGVSASTVSYALSGRRPISAAVKQRIENAIAELGFVPNTQAHNLRKGRSQMIGMVLPPSENMLEGTSIDFVTAAAEALKNAYTLSLFPFSPDVDYLLDAFRQKMIDGLIMMHIARRDARVEALYQTDYPFVLIGRTENTHGINLVDFDFEEATFLAIKHLAELGHKTIGYLDLSAKERQGDLGYAYYMQQGLKKASWAFKVSLMREEAGRRNKDSYDATKALIKKHPKLTAIVALLGATHPGILRALTEENKRVPEDYSLVCLGSASTAKWTTPRITTLDNQLADLGRIAAELLLERIQGNQTPKQILLSAALKVQESSAPPRS